MEFAAIHLINLEKLSETYTDHSHSEDYIHRSKYFKAGVDYLIMKIAYQTHQSMVLACLGDFNNGFIVPDKNFHENVKLKHSLATSFSTTSIALHQDLAAISMTPESFSQLVGDGKVPAMMASKPFPPDFQDCIAWILIAAITLTLHLWLSHESSAFASPHSTTPWLLRQTAASYPHAVGPMIG